MFYGKLQCFSFSDGHQSQQCLKSTETGLLKCSPISPLLCSLLAECRALTFQTEWTIVGCRRRQSSPETGGGRGCRACVQSSGSSTGRWTSHVPRGAASQ